MNRLFMFIISNVGYFRRMYIRSLVVNSKMNLNRDLPYNACVGVHWEHGKAVWVMVDDIIIRIEK